MAQKICYGCMNQKGESDARCPQCGLDETAYVQPEFALPLGSELHDGKYVVGKVLGQGGFGITYIGIDRTLNLKVAIKEYYPQTLASRHGGTGELTWHTSVTDRDAGRESFIKEARNMAKINEIPHLVQVREIFYQNATAYIIMNYIEGETLKAKLDREGIMHEADCLNLMRPLLDALAEAHASGLIHRDISPDNIMLAHTGKIWLLDMGEAKSLDTLSHNAPQSTHLVIRHGFSPIEQFADAGRIGPWTDVYALSATIYYCLTGKVLPDSLNRLSQDDVTFPASVSANVRAALQKGFAIKPEDRYQSIAEFQKALTDYSYVGDASSLGKEPKQTVRSDPAPMTEPVPPIPDASDSSEKKAHSAHEKVKKKNTGERRFFPFIEKHQILFALIPGIILIAVRLLFNSTWTHWVYTELNGWYGLSYKKPFGILLYENCVPIFFAFLGIWLEILILRSKLARWALPLYTLVVGVVLFYLYGFYRFQEAASIAVLIVAIPLLVFSIYLEAPISALRQKKFNAGEGLAKTLIVYALIGGVVFASIKVQLNGYYDLHEFRSLPRTGESFSLEGLSYTINVSKARETEATAALFEKAAKKKAELMVIDFFITNTTSKEQYEIPTEIYTTFLEIDHPLEVLMETRTNNSGETFKNYLTPLKPGEVRNVTCYCYTPWGDESEIMTAPYYSGRVFTYSSKIYHISFDYP